MSKKKVKEYYVEEINGTDFINRLEDILNYQYERGWEFVRIYSLKVNEYKILYRKIKDL